jgi:hypothetical protein
MLSSLARRLLAAAAFAAFAGGGAHADDAVDIGSATSITTSVTGAVSTASPVTLATGDGVFQNETITTDDKGVGQFQFNDQTKLALGPGSTIVLDNFVYDADGAAPSKIVIGLTSGAMRFITGKADHNSYEIDTPTATIGVRGTVFDVYTKPDGEMAVAMLDGAVEVCPKLGLCRLHNVVGKFLHMTPLGIFSLRDKWDGSFLKGIPFKVALPFMGDQDELVPALRGSARTVTGYVKLAADDIGKALKPPKLKLKLPKLKLPNPFK